jgi:hypothetical protein
MANETAVKTGLVRFSYAHIFEPQTDAVTGKQKYSVSILIPKTDVVTIKKIEAAIEAAKQVGLAKLGGKLAGVKTPLRDGDEDRPDDESYAGHMFMSANSNRRPGVIDANLQDITDDEDFYSGCYGRASVNFYAYNVDKSKGISCGLNNLQKLNDGERLGAPKVSAAADFGDDLM